MLLFLLIWMMVVFSVEIGIHLLDDSFVWEFVVYLVFSFDFDS